MMVDSREQESILRYLIPSKIVTKVQRNEVVIEKYDEATIFVAQIIGFTALTGQINAVEVITLLNEIYRNFDTLVTKHNVVKVETMGDVYVVIGGGPDICNSAVEGAEKVGLFALDAVNFVNAFKVDEGLSVFVRAGMATGQIVAGVIGSIKTFPKYSLFGDTLNFASLLQSTSKKMKIQIAETTHSLLNDSARLEFKCKERTDGGALVVSGVSVPDTSTRTWWLAGVKPRIKQGLKLSTSLQSGGKSSKSSVSDSKQDSKMGSSSSKRT